MLERLAKAAITPERREPAKTNVDWDSRDSIDAGGETLAYWSAGTGPAILLVHGWEGSHADLDAFVSPLLAAGLRVVAIDLPAHGESSGVTASPHDLGGAILALGAALGPFAGVIGHSAGCAATAYALVAGLRTDCVVLVGTPERYERYVRWVAQEAGVDGDALIEAFGVLGVDVRSLVMSDNAAQSNVPALVVHSNDDRTCDVRGALRVAAAWPRSETLLVDGLGHMRILRDPAVIDSIVAFVKRRDATA
jgi:pimeloyl-ACP methyl ester carboxylesterase